jgi:threonine/homoserine/homoserine lactone efflux protein
MVCRGPFAHWMEVGSVITLVDARFAAYIGISALLIVTPGPDTALVTRNALVAGRRAASATTTGIGAGSVVWAVASVLGVAVLLERSVTAFTIFKLAGAAYLCFLGVRALLPGLRVGRRLSEPHAGTGGEAIAPPGRVSDTPPAIRPSNIRLPRLRARSAFQQGLTSNLLNPKAGAIFATVLPQFIQPGDSPMRLGLMLLAYEAMLFAWLNLYGALVSRAGRSRAGGRVRAWLERATGAVLIALGIRLAVERR